MNGRARAAAIILTRDFQVLDEHKRPVLEVTKVRRRDVAALFGGDVLGAGAIQPLYAAEVGLSTHPAVINPLAISEAELLENGAKVLREVRRAIKLKDVLD